MIEEKLCLLEEEEEETNRHECCLGVGEMGDIPVTRGNKDNGKDPMKVDRSGHSKDKGTIKQQWINNLINYH